MEEQYLLTAKYNNELHTFEIDNIDQVKLNFENYVNSLLANIPEEITNDEEKKIVKKTRAEINKKLKQLKDGRITINNGILGSFNADVKSLESLLDLSSKSLTQKLNDYEPKEKKWTLTGFSTNKEQLEEIKQYAYELYKIDLEIK